MSFFVVLLGLLVLVGVSSGTPSAQDQTRIVDGTESAESQWPFFAGIINKQRKNPNAPYCGAVVWDQDTVLTAAHCVSGDDGNPKPLELFTVYMGYNSWTEPKHEEYMFKVREIINHPNYNKDNPFNDDIAFIFLDRNIDFDDINKKVQCVCDPEPLELLNTSACVTMGWGRDEENNKPTNLLEVVIPILDHQSCYHYGSGMFDPNHHLCAGYVDPLLPTGTCFGDSGGPLVCPQLADPSKFALVGISSFITANSGSKQVGCGQSPSYFTNVELRLKWIESVRPKTSNVQTPPQMSSSFGNRWFGKFGGIGKWW